MNHNHNYIGFQICWKKSPREIRIDMKQNWKKKKLERNYKLQVERGEERNYKLRWEYEVKCEGAGTR